MNIIFFGSSKYSTIVEESLVKNFGLSLVVTVADKIIGREKILKPTLVKLFAQKNNIPVIASDKLTDEIIDEIASYKPDFLVVADYGVLLPKKLLELPKKAPLNVHHSLLPKYRGPSPAPSAILAGEKVSGVTVMMMGEDLDTGDILAQKEWTLKQNETTDSLLSTLNKLGADLVCRVIEQFEDFYKNRTKQDEEKATFTSHMSKSDGFVEINNLPDPKKLDQMIRAYYPWPGVFTKMNIGGSEKIVKLLPGEKLQVEGKNPVGKKDFLNGYPQFKQLLERLFPE